MTRRRKLGLAALGLVVAPLLAHALVSVTTTVRPPAELVLPPDPVTKHGDVRRVRDGWTAKRGVRLVHLSGSPVLIGAAHASLLYDEMIETEGVVWRGFAALVPFAPARALMFDVGRVKYRNVASGFPPARRDEIAAEAARFAPDPFDGHLPTYHRFVMLHALYDIALGFEHSPLLGCTAFGVGPELTADGHALFARAFDFEAAEVFDREKAVFLVHETGKIPFASVAWPGFVGVVTGMNAEGVAVAVHGGRAREPATTGLPVAFSLRDVLATTRTTAEAVELLKSQEVMVSHIVFVGDAGGDYAVVERAPGVPAHVRRAPAVTNHFEGPLMADPRDARVRKETTTLPRRARIDELLAAVPPKTATPSSVLEMLRDHRCAGESCGVGDRRTIDAFIATHGVVADLTTHTLWVSEGPRLSGRFVRIDPKLLAQHPEVPGEDELETLPEDAALHDGRYDAGRRRAGGPLFK